jgi:uncharacterized membrane protein (GlpM family)
MNLQKVLPVLISVLVIVVVAIVQERSRYLGAIIAAMPVAAPLAIWIVYSSSGGDHEQTAFFTLSMVYGIFATMVFVAACWLALRQRWSLPVTLAVGYGVWLALVALPALWRGGPRP